MSVLPADVAVPEPTTRRARRLAAAAPAAPSAVEVALDATAAPVEESRPVIPGYGVHVATVSVPAAGAATAVVAPAPSIATTVEAAPLTRRELRRRAGEAFGLTAPAAETAETSTAPQTAAEVVAAAVAMTRPAATTRRELRAAALREAGALDQPAVSLQQHEVDSIAPAEQPVDLEFDFASVALTLSSLTATATVNAQPTATPVPAAPEQEPTAAATPAEGSVPGEALTRRARRASAAVPDVALEAIDPGAGSGSGTPRTPSEPGASASAGSEGTSPRQWVPRLAVLSALGVATVVTPIHAMAQNAGEVEISAAPLAAAGALDTLVATPQTLEAATATATADGEVAEAATAVDETASLLAADPVADVRGVVAASRSETRSDLPQCGPAETDQPNGTLAALESNEHLTLSMPVQEGVYRLSSGFGPRWGSIHYGTDFAAPLGTPIRAIAGGEVIHAGVGLAGRSPNLIAIRSVVDGEEIEIWYNHMFADGVFVEEGDIVQVGDVIGEVGNNGNSTGPHVHVEVHVGDLSDANGSAVDSLAWLRANDATPVTTSGAVCI